MAAGTKRSPAKRYAQMFAALGAESRLRIVQLLLTAHPQGLVAGDIQEELGIPASTLSHHLDKLKHKDLVHVRRQGTFLWYTASTDALQELINFLYAECCTRNRVLKADTVVAGADLQGLRLVCASSSPSPGRIRSKVCRGGDDEQ